MTGRDSKFKGFPDLEKARQHMAHCGVGEYSVVVDPPTLQRPDHSDKSEQYYAVAHGKMAGIYPVYLWVRNLFCVTNHSGFE